jgi:hypothetical protein
VSELQGIRPPLSMLKCGDAQQECNHRLWKGGTGFMSRCDNPICSACRGNPWASLGVRKHFNQAAIAAACRRMLISLISTQIYHALPRLVVLWRTLSPKYVSRRISSRTQPVSLTLLPMTERVFICVTNLGLQHMLEGHISAEKRCRKTFEYTKMNACLAETELSEPAVLDRITCGTRGRAMDQASECPDMLAKSEFEIALCTSSVAIGPSPTFDGSVREIMRDESELLLSCRPPPRAHPPRTERETLANLTVHALRRSACILLGVHRWLGVADLNGGRWEERERGQGRTRRTSPVATRWG